MKPNKKFDNAAIAFQWVMNHPKLLWKGFLEPWYSLEPHLVNPKTRRIEDDKALNTHLEWWIEGGPHIDYEDQDGNNTYVAYLEFETGGDTAEQAMLRFATMVYNKYGDYE